MEMLTELRDFFLENRLISEGLQVADSDSLLESGLIDSLGILELVTYLQQRHGILVRDVDLVPENFDSLSAISSFVERQQGKRGEQL